MKSRERVQKAITFDHPDRVPISHAILPAAQLKYGEALDEVLAAVHEDFGWGTMTDMAREDYPPQYRAGANYDDFGTLWRVEMEGVCGIPVEFPLADWNNYDQYVWPDFGAGPPRARLYSGHVAGKNGDHYARGAWITFFEELQQLRGMENLLVDLVHPSRELHRLIEELLEFNLKWIDRWLAFDYDGLHFADDWGAQDSLMVSPQLWRDLFVPVYRAMFDKVKSAGVDVHFHSDGQIVEIIPDLLELGVDVLNCQAAVVGLDVLKKEFAGKVCFRTDLDRQRIMPFGTPDEVRSHILDLFDHLGTPKGGLIACGEIGPDIPLENIKAMYDVFAQYTY
ncbi:MAG: uroporphyrinogen decarboxylase family protein [Pirellulales bacterium]